MSVVKESQITKLLSKYKNINATKEEVLEVLNKYRGLTCELKKYVFNDGTATDLFRLVGTIPVLFKNNVYNFPICIWLMRSHPQNAPWCFVEPTENMVVKVSMYVDHNGKIYLPYLHEWQPNRSDLLSLIEIMILTFGEYPPLYTRSAEKTTPYPTTNYGNNANLPVAAGGATGFTPYPSMFPTATPYPPGRPSGSSGAPYPPYMNYPMMPNYNPGYNPTPASSSTGTITEEHIKASLISAVEDKMRRRVQEKVNQYQAEIDTLNRTKQELMENSSKIDSIIARLQREEVELQKNLTMLRDKEKELEKNLEALEKSDGIDPDEAVTTTAPLYKQLLNAYSEEAATEDAIYYLGEALRSGVIDLDTFLKQVRQLSRKQFMLRALMQKCRQKAFKYE